MGVDTRMTKHITLIAIICRTRLSFYPSRARVLFEFYSTFNGSLSGPNARFAHSSRYNSHREPENIVEPSATAGALARTRSPVCQKRSVSVAQRPQFVNVVNVCKSCQESADQFESRLSDVRQQVSVPFAQRPGVGSSGRIPLATGRAAMPPISLCAIV
eukprot:11201608-Lingulodinium_polyedra.AAC.1